MAPSTPHVQWFAQTIECADPDVLADFYVSLMGGRVTHGQSGSTSVEAGGLLLNFHRVEGHRAPTWPSQDVPMQHHFDFVVEDLDAAVQEARRLGARRPDHRDPDARSYTVLLDPSGHPFCLISSSAAVRW